MRRGRCVGSISIIHCPVRKQTGQDNGAIAAARGRVVHPERWELPMIEQLQEFPANVVAFACKGRVTRLDYRTVLMPAVEGALREHDRVRLYYLIDADFSGFDPGAMWEDFKVGIEHLARWERIAVVTDVDWIRHTIRAFSFLIHGAVKIFPLDQAQKAREWVIAADAADIRL
jgi:hypothetical protein